MEMLKIKARMNNDESVLLKTKSNLMNDESIFFVDDGDSNNSIDEDEDNVDVRGWHAADQCRKSTDKREKRRMMLPGRHEKP